MTRRTSRRARGLMVKEIQKKLSLDNPPLPAQLEKYLTSYQPRSINPSVWEVIEPLVASTMRRAKVRGKGTTFEKKVRLVSYFFAWAVQNGYTSERDALLNEQVIGDYIRHGCKHVSAGSKSSYRSDLRSVMRAAGSELDQAHRFQRIASRTVRAPYTVEECSQLINTINYQPRYGNRRRLQACSALGLGAGIDSADLMEMRAGDITDHGEDGIEIRVRGRMPRTVWQLHEYEEILRTGIQGLGPRTLVLTGTSLASKNSVNKLNSQIVHTGRHPLKLEQARIRNTWLLRLLQAPVPLGLVMQVAGLKSARTLADLVTYVSETQEKIDIRTLIKEIKIS